LKVERRDNSVLISHNGITIFANLLQDGSYTLKVTKRLHDVDGNETWITVGNMTVPKNAFYEFVDLLGDLAK
jgi:hypothetical protein